MSTGNAARRLRVSSVVALLLACAAPESPAQSFPVRPILMIVPFPAGVSDRLARAIAAEMEPALGQKIVVEPRPGAGTVVGTQFVIGQAPDGYTVLYASSSLAIKSSVAKPPFDARRDVTAVGQLNNPGLVLAVNSRLPVNSARELVEYARANPGRLNMTTYGVGTSGHLMGALLVHQQGLKVTTVPFAGSAQNALALSQGNGDFTFDVLGSLRPHVEAGRVRVLAVSLAERDAASPEVPSMAESGVPGYSMSAWSGLVTPAGTPREVVQKLNAALGRAVRAPSAREAFARISLNLLPEASTPEQFRRTIDQDVETLSRLIREAKLDVE